MRLKTSSVLSRGEARHEHMEADGTGTMFPPIHAHTQTHTHAHTHICMPTESPPTLGMRDIRETNRHHACPYKAFCFERRIGPESVLSGVKKGEKLGQKGLLGRGRVWDAFRILACVFLRNHSTFPFNLLTPGFGLCAG